MKLAPRNKLVTGAFDCIYRDTRAKGDRPREWSYRKPKRRPVKQVAVEAYLQEQQRS